MNPRDTAGNTEEEEKELCIVHNHSEEETPYKWAVGDGMRVDNTLIPTGESS